MTPITTTKAKLLFVEVEDDVAELYMMKYIANVVFFKIKSGADHGTILLPSGSKYSILFTTKQATEEDWKGVVDEQFDTYLDYEADEDEDIGNVANFSFATATSSGLSLQKANGMDVNKNYAVIKID